MYATVFEGSKEEGLDRDNEAAAIWERFLPKDHILNGNNEGKHFYGRWVIMAEDKMSLSLICKKKRGPYGYFYRQDRH